MKASLAAVLVLLLAITSCAKQRNTDLVYFLGTPWAEGHFNGEPAWFLIDTGASITVVDSDLARELGSYRTGEREVIGTTGRTTLESGWAQKLHLAGRTHYDRHISVQSMSNFQGPLGLKQGGLIGCDFLTEYTVIFDMERARIHLSRREAPLDQTLTPFRMPLYNGTPAIEVAFDGLETPVWAKLDTGSGYAEESHLYLDVSEPLARRLLGERYHAGPDATATVISVAGSEVLPIYNFSGVEMLGQRLENVRLVVHTHGRGAFTEPDRVLVTGSVLRRFTRLELDFQRRVIWAGV